MKWKDVKEFLRPNKGKLLFWLPFIISAIFLGFTLIVIPIFYGVFGILLIRILYGYYFPMMQNPVTIVSYLMITGFGTYLISCFLEKLSHKPKYFVIYYVISYILIGFIVVEWLMASMPARPPGIELTDSFCLEGVVHIEFRNLGKEYDVNEISVERTEPIAGPDTPTTCCDNLLTPGEDGDYTDPTCGIGNRCTYRISPPGAKILIAIVTCP